jgi:arylformamidase
MPFNWRELPVDQMEQHFNPRSVNPDIQDHVDRYIARSAEARLASPGQYDLRYGEGEKQTLDIHIPQSCVKDAPLAIFIHGGYWRGLDKQDHSFVVPPIVASGAIVANVNYDLCPQVTLDVIVDEIAQAVSYCHLNAEQWGADPNNLYLIGHSAGAHLGARMLLRDWPQHELNTAALRGVAAITGVYEPEVILDVSVNQEAQISAQTARQQSCLDRAFTSNPNMLIAVGGDEPGGWIGQSQSFAAQCIDAKLHTQMFIVPDTNHMTVLEHAFNTDEPLCTAILDLWR